MNKKILFFLPFVLYASILSDLKQKEFNLDKEKSLKDSIETKRSWINPIILKFTYQKDNTQGFQTTSKIYTLSINQPIFKSGAIYYSIKYADVLKNFNATNILLQKRALIKQAYDLVFDYKISQIDKKILKLQIENAKIDVSRKKEDYLKGIKSSNELDNALLNLNNLKLSLIDLNLSISNIKTNFANLSDLDIDRVTLPKLTLISQKNFLKKNLNLKLQKMNEKIKHYLYKMQVGNELLTISFNGSYNYQDTKNRVNTNKQNYYIVGISATIPIDINAKPKIEKAKLSYLKSKILYQDKKKELINTYNQIVLTIQALKNKIKIYKENAKIYSNLIKSTQDSIKAGNATKIDLKILQNSKMRALLNVKKTELLIQKKLLNLYYQLVSFSNN